MSFNDRRKSERHIMAGLVMVIFVLLAAFVVVLTAALDLVRDVKALTAATQDTAIETKRVSEDTAALVEQSKPCNPGDPPETPGCERARRTETIITLAIDAILRALAGAIEAHDLNTHLQHEDLRQRIPATTAPTVPVSRTPITAPPTTAVVAPTTTTTTRPVPLPSLVPSLPAPTTTTTTTAAPPPPPPPSLSGRSAPPPPPTSKAAKTCDTLPNGRCHPRRT